MFKKKKKIVELRYHFLMGDDVNQACMALMEAIRKSSSCSLVPLLVQLRTSVRTLTQIQSRVEFILIPLLLFLPSSVKTSQSQRSDREQEESLITIMDIMKLCTLDFVQSRLDIFSRVIDACLGVISHLEGKEETKELAIVLVDCITRNMNSTLLGELSASGRLTGLFAQTIVCYLKMIQLTNSKALRLDGISSLKGFLQQMIYFDKCTVAAVVPGIAAGLVPLILGDFKIGSSVRKSTIDLWSQVAVCSLGTSKDADSNIHKIFKAMASSSVLSESVSVNQSIVNMCMVVLTQCYPHLEDHGSILFEMLLSKSNDIGSLKYHFETSPGNVWVAEISPSLSRKLDGLLLSLPRFVRKGDESLSRSVLRSCTGLVRATSTIVDPDMVVTSLIQMVQFAPMTSVKVSAVVALRYESQVAHSFPSRHFEYFRDALTVDAIQELLAAFDSDLLLLDYLLQNLKEGDRCAERLYLAINIIGPRSQCISEYLLDLSVQYIQEANTPLSKSLALECLSKVLRHSGNISLCKKWLVKIIFPVLEQVTVDHQSALAALETMVVTCGYQSTSELINSNMDYILDALVIRLVDLELFPETPSIVKVMLEMFLVHDELIPFLKDITEAFLKCVDKYKKYEDYLIQLFSVLKPVIDSLPTRDNDTIRCPVAKKDYIEELIQEFSPPAEEASEEIDEELDGIKKPTESDCIVEMIVGSCRHFLLHPCMFIRRLALSTIDASLMTIGSARLRMMVHSIWSPVSNLLQMETSEPVRKVVYKLVITCIQTSREFMDSRFAEQVLPILLKTRNSLIVPSLDCLIQAQRNLPEMAMDDQLDIVNAIARFLSPKFGHEINSKALEAWMGVNKDVTWLCVASTACSRKCDLKFAKILPSPHKVALKLPGDVSLNTVELMWSFY